MFIKLDYEKNKAGLMHRPLPPGPQVAAVFPLVLLYLCSVEQEVTVWRSWSQQLTSLISCHLWLISALWQQISK